MTTIFGNTDRISAYVTPRNNTTYVTYTSDGLPLANLIRDVVPFGDQIADLIEPTLKVIVDSAYYDGNPMPRHPSAYRPARLFPAPAELIATAAKIPGAIEQGLAAATSSSTRSALSTNSPAAQTSEPTRKPLVTVVRDNAKAVPGKIGFDGNGAEATANQPQTEDNSATVVLSTQPEPADGENTGDAGQGSGDNES